MKESKPPSTESQDTRQKIILVRPDDLEEETLRALVKKVFEQLKANGNKP